ncbi:MAG: Arsenate reductase (Thioredoxin) [uncultured bacterium]|nr:MAG: Arsenate reductase (Thioredoxin) [uncultured bacterium]
MAVGFFLHQLRSHPTISVTSAGISALVDHPADTHALTVMNQHGIDISSHRARQINQQLIQNAELILVMTQAHLKALHHLSVHAKGKTFLLGHWQDCEIYDPYMLPHHAFETTYQQIELAWLTWQTRITTCQPVST